ncbi:MAG: tetratricopeptide repeat protein [bacterium]
MSKKRNSRKRRKKSLKRSNPQLHRTEIPSTTTRLVSYDYNITDEPIKNLVKIPKEIEKEVEELFYKSQERPEEAIEPLETLIKDYPFIPQLYNYLGVAYSRIGDYRNAQKIAKINYEKNPHYLFAKLNYAEICLQKGEAEKIPEIFDNKFELKALYPKRNEFHITEVAGFWGVMGIYFSLIGFTEQAQLYYKLLKELAPENPYTKNLGFQLTCSSFKNRLLSIKDKMIPKK